MRIALVWCVVAACLGACGRVVERHDRNLSYENGMLYYKKQPFAGQLTAYYANGRLRSQTRYAAGWKDGLEHEYFENGTVAAARLHRAGRKVGVHRGWHEDGAVRFYSAYTDDHFVGESFAWYPDGTPAYYARYAPDGQLLGLKQWRADGKVFMNYVVVGADRRGLYGGKLCYTVKGDKNGITVSYK